MSDDGLGVLAGVGVARLDGGHQRPGRRGAQLQRAGALLELLALELVGDHPREDVEELQVALAQPGPRPVSGRAEGPVDPSVGEPDRHRRERPDVGGGHDEQVAHGLDVADVGHHLRRLAGQHPTAQRVLDGQGPAVGEVERRAVALGHPQVLRVAHDLTGVGHVEVQELAHGRDGPLDRRALRHVAEGGEGGGRAVGTCGHGPCGHAAAAGTVRGRLHPEGVLPDVQGAEGAPTAPQPETRTRLTHRGRSSRVLLCPPAPASPSAPPCCSPRSPPPRPPPRPRRSRSPRPPTPTTARATATARCARPSRRPTTRPASTRWPSPPAPSRSRGPRAATTTTSTATSTSTARSTSRAPAWAARSSTATATRSRTSTGPPRTSSASTT